MDAVAVLDGSVWSLGSCRTQYEEISHSRIVIKYKYYLSKIEDNLGNPIVWTHNEDSRQHADLHCVTSRKETPKRLFSEDSGCSSQSDMSASEVGASEMKFNFPPVLAVAFRNSPEEQKPRLRRAWNVSLEVQSDISKSKLSYDENGELRRRTKQNIMKTQSEEELADSCEEIKSFSLSNTDVGRQENIEQLDGNEDRMIVKYKYLLSRKKDVVGNRIEWYDPTQNNKRTDVHNRTSSDDFIFMEYKQMTPQTSFKSSRMETENFLENYNVKSTETTVFSHESIQTDNDFRQLTGGCNEDIRPKRYKCSSNCSMSSGYQSSPNLSSNAGQMFTSDAAIEEVFEDNPKTSSPRIDKTRSSKAFTQEVAASQILANESQSKKRERVTFMANLGSMPYQAVFRLDDDIRHLKTFIHLISGLPAYRQKYSYGVLSNAGNNYQGKRSKKRVKFVRDLGLCDGQKIYLGVVDA